VKYRVYVVTEVEAESPEEAAGMAAIEVALGNWKFDHICPLWTARPGPTDRDWEAAE
jgi:hypothetical protein